MNPTAPTLESTIARMPHGTVPHVGANAHVAPHTPNASSAEIAGKGAIEAAAANTPQLNKEQQEAATLRGVKSKFMLPATWEMTGMLAGGALGWVAKKFGWQPAQAVINVVAKAPVQAMRNTPITEITRLPAHMFEEASRQAGLVGGKKATKWSQDAAKHADVWMQRATGMTREQLKNVPVSNVADAAETAQGINKYLGRFIDNRQASAIAKHEKAFAEAHAAITTESIGLKQKLSNKLRKVEPATVKPGELENVFEGLSKVRALPVTERTSHLRGVMHDLESHLFNPSLSAEAKGRAGSVMRHLENAIHSAGTAETLSTNRTLRALAGRVPVYHALLSVGLLAGLGAVAMTARGESEEAKEALKKVNALLPDAPNSEFKQSITLAQKNAKHGGALKTGMRAAGEVADVSMWMMHGGGGAAMMGAMMVPQLVETLVADNAMLGALEALDKGDKGQAKLTPAERTQLMTQVIGGMKSVAAHGGPYNRLAKNMAAEMQERNFTYGDFVKTLGSDAAFKQFAAEVSAKQQATTAEKPVAAEAVTLATKAPMAAPSTRIGVGAADAQHKGMVVDNRQLAVG